MLPAGAARGKRATAPGARARRQGSCRACAMRARSQRNEPAATDRDIGRRALSSCARRRALELANAAAAASLARRLLAVACLPSPLDPSAVANVVANAGRFRHRTFAGSSCAQSRFPPNAPGAPPDACAIASRRFRSAMALAVCAVAVAAVRACSVCRASVGTRVRTSPYRTGARIRELRRIERIAI